MRNLTDFQKQELKEAMMDYKKTKNPVDLSITADGYAWEFDYVENPKHYAQLARLLKKVYNVILERKLNILRERKELGVSCEAQRKMMLMDW